MAKKTDPSTKLTRKNPMINLLEQPDYGASNTMHPLGRVWRLLLRQMDVSIQEYLVKQSLWQTKLSALIGVAQALQMKGNVNDALSQEEISWNTLVRGIAMMNFSHFTITLKCYRNLDDTNPITVDCTVDKLNEIEEEK